MRSRASVSALPESAEIRRSWTIQGADLYCDIAEKTDTSVRDHLPGMALAGIATLAAAYLSLRYDAPLTVMALLVGLAMNGMGADKRLEPGLGFASRILLRWGIVLVGLRVTLDQVIAIGPVGLVSIVAITAAVLGAGILASRRLGHGGPFGALAAGAVAICGASAAMAIYSMLGERRITQTQLVLVLVGTSILSSSAMLVYPMLVYYAGIDDSKAGFIMGAAIHDVAQSLGAGYSISPHSGEVATIVKMTRVALLVPVLLAIRFTMARGESGGRMTLRDQWFVIGFFAMALIASLGLVPQDVRLVATDMSSAMLACALSATAMRSPLSGFQDLGFRPLIVTLVCTMLSLALSVAVAVNLIR